MIVTGKLHQQNRFRFADQRLLDDRAERRILKRQLDHGAVNQLHRRGAKLDDMLGEIHGLIKGREIHHAQHFLFRQRGKPELNTLAHAERAFRTHQQVSQVGTTVRVVGHWVLAIEQIQIVATHPAQHFGKVIANFRAHTLGNCLHLLRKALLLRAFREAVNETKARRAAVGQ